MSGKYGYKAGTGFYHLRLPQSLLDRAREDAARQELPLSEWMRQAVEHRIAQPFDSPAGAPALDTAALLERLRTTTEVN